MAYARKKGNQVVIVHGQRDPDTKRVQQRTLFMFYSKAEIHAAIGKSSYFFQQFLADEYPSIRFDWKKLNISIKEQMDALPDLHSYKKDRVDGRFRAAVIDFTRELLIADPQTLISSARLLQDQRYELEYLRDLIDWRLKCADQEENEWNKDNPFYWRTLMNRRNVSPEGMDKLATLYQEMEYEKAAALARLLIECWGNYAEGHNYLGLISMDRNDLNAARKHFDKAMEVGRTLFPKRIRKGLYWSDLSTRPYIRAIIYSAQTHNRIGELSTALHLCDKLEHECNQEITAATERIAIYLNSGSWELAANAARFVHKIYPQKNLPFAFALYEMEEEREALVHFLNGAIRFPRTARMLCGLRRTKNPDSKDEVDDHDLGVGYLRDLEYYLENRQDTVKRFFVDILKSPKVKALIKEAYNARQDWREGRTADRTVFLRIEELESIEFARTTIAEI